MTESTSTVSHDVVRRVIDGYFAGNGSLRAAMSHLDECNDCTQYFSRRQMVANLDPKAMNLEARMAKSLGLSSRDPTPESAGMFAGGWRMASASALAAVALVIAWPADVGPNVDDGFTGRGTQVERVLDDVRVFNVTGNGSVPLTGKMNATDELAFAYRNPRGHPYLMVFAVAEDKSVYWYHPAWTDPEANPSAIPVQKSEVMIELKEAVRHDLSSTTDVAIYAMFADEPLTVRAVEQMIADGGRPPDAARKLEAVRIEK